MFPLFAHIAPSYIQTVSLTQINTRHGHCGLVIYHYEITVRDGSVSNYNLFVVYVQFLMANSATRFHYKLLTLSRFAARLTRGALDYKALIDA